MIDAALWSGGRNRGRCSGRRSRRCAGGLMTDVGAWYESLTFPRLRPPNWLFGPAWTVIFMLIAAGGVIAWEHADSADRLRLIVLFAINGVLNVLWSPLFFKLRRPGLGFLRIDPFLAVGSRSCRRVVAHLEPRRMADRALPRLGHLRRLAELAGRPVEQAVRRRALGASDVEESWKAMAASLLDGTRGRRDRRARRDRGPRPCRVAVADRRRSSDRGDGRQSAGRRLPAVRFARGVDRRLPRNDCSQPRRVVLRSWRRSRRALESGSVVTPAGRPWERVPIRHPRAGMSVVNSHLHRRIIVNVPLQVLNFRVQSPGSRQDGTSEVAWGGWLWRRKETFP